MSPSFVLVVLAPGYGSGAGDDVVDSADDDDDRGNDDDDNDDGDTGDKD